MNETTRVNLTTVVTHGDDHIAASIDRDVVMMSVRQGKYYSLDAIGSRIWELIMEPRSVSALCDILQGEFDVDRVTCERDVLALLNELAKERLIKVIDGAIG